MHTQLLFLRKELHRYQLELLNHENSYNRLFSNRQAPARDTYATKYDLTGTKVRQIVPDLPHSPAARYTSFNSSNELISCHRSLSIPPVNIRKRLVF